MATEPSVLVKLPVDVFVVVGTVVVVVVGTVAVCVVVDSVVVTVVGPVVIIGIIVVVVVGVARVIVVVFSPDCVVLIILVLPTPQFSLSLFLDPPKNALNSKHINDTIDVLTNINKRKVVH